MYLISIFLYINNEIIYYNDKLDYSSYSRVN